MSNCSSLFLTAAAQAITKQISSREFFEEKFPHCAYLVSSDVFLPRKMACRKKCVLPTLPHAWGSTLLPLPRQDFDLEALLSVDSLRERLPRNSAWLGLHKTLWGFELLPPAAILTFFSALCWVLWHCYSCLTCTALIPCENSLNSRIPIVALMIFLLFVRFAWKGYLWFPTTNIKIHTLQSTLIR